MTCKNHQNSKAIYRCKTCSTAICSLCFNKIQYNEGKKKVGFCSTECRGKYIQQIKIIRKQNFPLARKEFLKGVALLTVSLMILFFVLFLVERGENEDGTKFHFFVSMSIGITALIKIFNVFASYKSGFRELKRPSGIMGKGPEYYAEDDLNEVNYSTATKPSIISDALIICYNISQDELKSGIGEFQSLMSISGKIKQVKHIISFLSKDDITLLKFDPEIHAYMLYNLMGYFDSSKSLAYFNLRGEKYMLRDEPGQDFLYCIDEHGRAYKISKVDGSISKIKVCKYQFLELTFNPDDFSKFDQMQIHIQSVGDYGSPVFK